MRGQLTEKVDIFAFGVVALEAVSGRSNTDSSLNTDSNIFLLEWVCKVFDDISIQENSPNPILSAY
jgi:hypothetical protein